MDSPFILKNLVSCKECGEKLETKNQTSAKSKTDGSIYFCPKCKSKIKKDVLNQIVIQDFADRWGREINFYPQRLKIEMTDWKRVCRRKVSDLAAVIEKLRFTISTLNPTDENYTEILEITQLQLKSMEKDKILLSGCTEESQSTEDINELKTEVETIRSEMDELVKEIFSKEKEIEDLKEKQSKNETADPSLDTESESSFLEGEEYKEKSDLTEQLLKDLESGDTELIEPWLGADIEITNNGIESFSENINGFVYLGSHEDHFNYAPNWIQGGESTFSVMYIPASATQITLFFKKESSSKHGYRITGFDFDA